MLFVGIDVAKSKHDCCIIDSNGVILTDSLRISNTKEGFEDALNSLKDEIIDDIGGFDFKIELEDNRFRILFGMEPSYMYDPYICYCFDSKKEKSYIHKGQSSGYYGSDIKIKSKKSYKRCGKEFRECIDKHWDNLMRCLSE